MPEVAEIVHAARRRGKARLDGRIADQQTRSTALRVRREGIVRILKLGTEAEPAFTNRHEQRAAGCRLSCHRYRTVGEILQRAVADAATAANLVARSDADIGQKQERIGLL